VEDRKDSHKDFQLIVADIPTKNRLPELGQGEFDPEGERLASPFSNPAESMSADGPC
jgi:hypothetical protein